MVHVLFVCSRNQLRSPTAEEVFSKWPGIEVASAGLDPKSKEPVTPELLAWAEVIFVMEKVHRNKLLKGFRANIKNQKIVVLGITDDYEYMDILRLAEQFVLSMHSPGTGELEAWRSQVVSETPRL
ncbi:MAG TPA: hypothetical protein VNO32_01435 [Candidatus Acidoferrum sp.]|jgi:predicted protein tyrosine phosphatase|nr:hypothetical protein [Candidatus Acidoferrum sp.]